MPKTFLDKNNNTLYTGYETKEIVANPELAGDEETLKGLEIGKTKYKVGGGGGSAQHYHKVVLATENTEQYCFGEYLLLDVYIDNPKKLTVKDIWDYIRSHTTTFLEDGILIQTNYGNIGTIYYDNCAPTDPLFDAGGGISVRDFSTTMNIELLPSTLVTIVYDQYI